MKFGLFVYCTVGRRHELEQGMAGRRPELYHRMLAELGHLAGFAEERGYFAFGHPEHHLQIEGFEISNDPCLMAMWLGQHTKKMRIVTCGFVSTANNPLQTAEKIATLDHMLEGRFGVGLVRGYQSRWVENYKVKPELSAVGPWNAKSPADELNREYFGEFVDIVVTALASETFSYQGKFWQFPPEGFVNPHDHPVYYNYGQGVNEDMSVVEVGIAGIDTALWRLLPEPDHCQILGQIQGPAYYPVGKYRIPKTVVEGMGRRSTGLGPRC